MCPVDKLAQFLNDDLIVNKRLRAFDNEPSRHCIVTPHLRATRLVSIALILKNIGEGRLIRYTPRANGPLEDRIGIVGWIQK